MKLIGSEQFVAIACGGTGGHLFPGIAVGEKLLERGCDVALLVSNKEIDQLSSRGATGMEVVSTPAVPLLKGNFPALFFMRYIINITNSDQYECTRFMTPQVIAGAEAMVAVAAERF